MSESVCVFVCVCTQPTIGAQSMITQGYPGVIMTSYLFSGANENKN